MKISVITVCYNAQATIGHTISSFLAQDWPHKEMIIVDGASTDATLEVVRSFPQKQLKVLSEPDRGMYDALNKRLGLFSGDAVGVLNADDAYHDASALRFVATGLKEADIVHGHLDFVDNQHDKKVVRRWRAQPRPWNGFASGWMPAHPTFYVRRKVAETVGAFDLSLPTASDYEWMIRAVELHGFSSDVVPHVLVDMALGGKSTSSLAAHLRHNFEALQARRRWLGVGFADYALFAKPARKLAQFAVGRRQTR